MRYEVSEADTASALGSSDVPVLATPRLIAWLEAATGRPSLSLRPAYHGPRRIVPAWMAWPRHPDLAGSAPKTRFRQDGTPSRPA